MVKEILFYRSQNQLWNANCYYNIIGADAKDQERPNPWWASCEDKKVHNIHGKNLSIDNIFENQTIALDDYKGKVRKPTYSFY